MGLFDKKVKSILRPEDIKELAELERNAYMEQARTLVVEKGKQDAKNQIKAKEIY